MKSGNVQVTTEEAIRFLESAVRNWQHVNFDRDGLEDVRIELNRFRLAALSCELDEARRLITQWVDWEESFAENHKLHPFIGRAREFLSHTGGTNA